MARNSEKAMTTLARWRAAHLDIVKEQLMKEDPEKYYCADTMVEMRKNFEEMHDMSEGVLYNERMNQRFCDKTERRPYLATECNDLDKAEKFRRQIIGEVSKKVAQIQNAGLGEFKLRDLNDEINKLLREKGHWEDQIKVLGGPDYRKIGPKMLDQEGKEVPGNKGYKYFGAAKDLPGVRELFQQAPPPPPRKTRAELMKNINADYYGYRDEDDGILCEIEQEKEKKLIAEKIEEWREHREAGEITETGDDDSGTANINDELDEGLEEMKKKVLGHFQPFVAHVPVPSQKEVEAALLERKKEQLRQRYISEALQQQTEEAKTLSLAGN